MYAVRPCSGRSIDVISGGYEYDWAGPPRTVTVQTTSRRTLPTAVNSLENRCACATGARPVRKPVCVSRCWLATNHHDSLSVCLGWETRHNERLATPTPTDSHEGWFPPLEKVDLLCARFENIIYTRNLVVRTQIMQLRLVTEIKKSWYDNTSSSSSSSKVNVDLYSALSWTHL